MSTGLLLAAYYIPRGIFVPKKARVGGIETQQAWRSLRCDASTTGETLAGLPACCKLSEGFIDL